MGWDRESIFVNVRHSLQFLLLIILLRYSLLFYFVMWLYFGVCSMGVPTWWLQGRVCFSGASCATHWSFDGKECCTRTTMHICTGCFTGCDLIWFNISEDAKGTGNLFLFCFTGRQDTSILEMHWTAIVNSYPPTPPGKMTLAKGRTQTGP